MARILIVDGERDLNDAIAGRLREEGHAVAQAFDGPRGVAAVEAEPPDLVVLDLALPGLDGLAVIRRIRRRHPVPILVVTARAEEADVVLGLEVGADDYLTKPVRMRELLARVRALLRRVERQRTGASPDDRVRAVVRVGPLAVDPGARVATVRGEALDLGPKEFEVLAVLVRSPGCACSRDHLLLRVWGEDPGVADRTVDTHVGRLRRKLGDAGGLIQTVWGVGYRLRAPAVAESDRARH